MAGFGTFDAGNALARGFATGSQIAKAREAQTAGPQMMGGFGGVPMTNALAYKAQRQMIGDQQQDMKFATEQEQSAYERSQRPMGEAQAGADLQKTKAEVESVKAQTAQTVAQTAKTLSDTELQQERASASQLYQGARQVVIDMGLGFDEATGQMTIANPAAWDRFEQLAGDDLRAAGYDPADIGPEDAYLVLGLIRGGVEGLDAEYEDRFLAGTRQGQSVPTDAQEGPSFRPATPEEAAKYGAKTGQIDAASGRFYPTKAEKGLRVETRPDGTMTLVQGDVEDQADPTSPSSPAAMISSIDGVLSDPAFNRSTGLLSFMQGIPGTESRRFGARMDQLQGQAFLQAFESLKGAGQITEIEGQKATQAIGRLDSSQRPEDLRAALEELKGILELGMQRPEGWANRDGASAGAPPGGNPYAGMSMAELAQMDIPDDPEALDAYIAAQEAALGGR